MLGHRTALAPRAQQQTHRQHCEHVAPGSFQHQRDPHRLTRSQLLQHRQHDGAAGASQHRSHRQRRGERQSQTLVDNQPNQRNAEAVSQHRQQHAAGKMPQGAAQVQVEPALKKHKDDGQCAQHIRSRGKMRRIHKTQHWTQHQSQRHQHQHVGHASHPEDAVGQKSQHQQRADQAEDECGRHCWKES